MESKPLTLGVRWFLLTLHRTRPPTASQKPKARSQARAKPEAKPEAKSVAEPSPTAIPDGTARAPLFNRQLFAIVTLMLLVQLLLLVGNLWFQYHNYATGIALAERAGAAADTVSLILVYSRAWDFAVTKINSVAAAGPRSLFGSDEGGELSAPLAP